MKGKEIIRLIEEQHAENFEVLVEIVSNNRVYTYNVVSDKSDDDKKVITLLGMIIP